MSETLYAENVHPTYENISATCPVCKARVVYNRVTEIKEALPVSHKKMACLNCKTVIALTGDSISPRYMQLIFDCYDLRDQKFYMACVLGATQVLEVFFSEYLWHELVRKQWNSGDRHTERRSRELAKDLYKATEKLPYEKMRNAFLNYVIREETSGWSEPAEKRILELASMTTSPKDDLIKTISSQELVELLILLKNLKVLSLRNRVVHKHAYRPTLSEVDKAIEEVRKVLFPLSIILIQDYTNF